MKIAFLMCSERSGSNLITKLLNAHSKICGPSTKHVFNPVARNLFRYEPLSDQGNWRALVADIHNLMSVAFSVWKRDFTLDDLLGLAEPGDVVSLLRNIFFEETKANGKEDVFVKENHIYEFLPFLLLHFPEAKYVFLCRDPRDMALSWKKSKDHPGGVVAAARQWQKDQQNTLKNVSELTKLGRAISLRYEDLIERPADELDRVVRSLGHVPEPSMLDFHRDALTRANAGNQAAWENLGKGIMDDNKNKYLNELSEREIVAIEKICWFEMNHLGYLPEFERWQVEAFSEDDLAALESEEKNSIPLNRSEGVVANMAAKKRFYQRVSWHRD